MVAWLWISVLGGVGGAIAEVIVNGSTAALSLLGKITSLCWQ
ncbi:hypothetical protein [Syntrophomonas palmitatica]|nr:hypothetical protein [Syntrophomonas palmitatica]